MFGLVALTHIACTVVLSASVQHSPQDSGYSSHWDLDHWSLGPQVLGPVFIVSHFYRSWGTRNMQGHGQLGGQTQPLMPSITVPLNSLNSYETKFRR